MATVEANGSQNGKYSAVTLLRTLFYLVATALVAVLAYANAVTVGGIEREISRKAEAAELCALEKKHDTDMGAAREIVKTEMKSLREHMDTRLDRLEEMVRSRPASDRSGG